MEIRRPEADCMSYKIPVTDCCGIGPITNEKYCPECGKRIIKD